MTPIRAAFLAFAAITVVVAVLAIAGPVTWTSTARHGVAQAILGFVGCVDLIVIGLGSGPGNLYLAGTWTAWWPPQLAPGTLMSPGWRFNL